MISNVQLKWWWVVISFFIGTLLGSGAIWQWFNVNLAEAQLELNKQKHIIELRDKIEDSLFKINRLSRESLNIKGSSKISEFKKNQIKSESELLIQDLMEFEKQLAKLENRATRHIAIPSPFPDKIPPSKPKIGIVTIERSFWEIFRDYSIIYFAPLIIVLIIVLKTNLLSRYISRIPSHLITVFASIDLLGFIGYLPEPHTFKSLVSCTDLKVWGSIFLLFSFLISAYGFFRKRIWAFWLYYGQFALRLALKIYSFWFIYYFFYLIMTMPRYLTIAITSLIVLLEYCRLVITIYLHRLKKKTIYTGSSFEYQI